MAPEIAQVPDGEPGAQAGAVCLIKIDKRWERIITGDATVSTEKLRLHLRRAQALAFHGEKRQLIDGIDKTKGTVEFQAVENHRRRFHTHMLRTQIAMALDDPAVRGAALE